MIKITLNEGNAITGCTAEYGMLEVNDMCKTLDDLREVLNNHRSDDKSKAKIYASDELLERCAKHIYAFVKDSHTARSAFDKIDINDVLKAK